MAEQQVRIGMPITEMSASESVPQLRVVLTYHNGCSGGRGPLVGVVRRGGSYLRLRRHVGRRIAVGVGRRVVCACVCGEARVTRVG